MSLDVYLTEVRPTEVFSANITHNLNNMAQAAGIYEPVWRSDECGITQAYQLIKLLERGIADMKARPDYYRKFDSPNGWGKYEHFLPWLERYLQACKENPEATVRASR